MKKIFKNEKGQSLVEFALILPIIIIIAMLPVDFFRYINTKILLSSAVSQCICSVDFDQLNNGTDISSIRTVAEKNYKDRLDISKITFTRSYNEGEKKKKYYNFYVYSSDRANNDSKKYWDQFKRRTSNYTKVPIELKASYTMSPITFWGTLFFGKEITVETKTFAREVYVNGYEE